MEEKLPFTSNMENGRDIFSLSKEDIEAALDRLRKGFPSFYGPATTNSLSCVLAAKTPNKSPKKRPATEETIAHGWVRCKVGGQKPEYYAHHLALIVAGRKEELLKKEQRRSSVSHLCHQRTCFNAAHLVVESSEKNRDRNKCIGWTYITCPCPCNHKFNACKHTPQCILPE